MPRNARSQAFDFRPAITAPGRAYDTCSSETPICAAISRARTTATPCNSPVFGSFVAMMGATAKPARIFPDLSRSATRASDAGHAVEIVNGDDKIAAPREIASRRFMVFAPRADVQCVRMQSDDQGRSLWQTWGRSGRSLLAL